MAVGAGRIFAINLLANSKPAEDAFERVGKAAGRIPTPMKVAAAAITAVFAAVSAVAIKSFKALLELGEEFNEVTRIIRVGTGAVGGDLAALEQSFRNVALSVPNAFGDIAGVVAELDTRTDLAGEGLEQMAEQLLTLSRLMGGDARSTTREVTRLFNRFGLSAEESSDMLDLLFRASQASGAEVGQLAADVTKNAGALRAMGLSLEESVALFAMFEREGVRSRTVVSALQSGIARLTKDGTVPMREALADAFTELRTLDRAAAEARGFELFGDSALELIDAIRDGRLSIADFTKQLLEGEDTIIGVAAETDGWRQKLAELKNFLKIEFEGVAREVFANVTRFVDQLKQAAERVVEAFERDGLQGALAQVAVEWKRIYEDDIKPLWERFLAFLDEYVKPIALQLGKDIGTAIVNGMKQAVRDSIPSIRGLLRDAFQPPDVPMPDRSGNVGSPLLPGEREMLDRMFGIPQVQPAPAPSPSRSTSPSGSGSLGGTSFTSPTTDLGGTIIPFASGGIVMSPTLGLVGEAGPEAVIPLDRFERGGPSYVINVSGAIDPEGTARTIRRVLQDAERRTGVRL